MAMLLGAFLFVLLHDIPHNSHDHKHDASCSIYVLEQLFFGPDNTDIISIPTLFIAIVFLLFKATVPYLKVERQFTIRAPPLT